MKPAIAIASPLSPEDAQSLRCGDAIEITGTIYTARDAAHMRMVDEIERGGKPPFDLKGQIVYYAGPAPAKPGSVIGSCGPTTSGRMDAFTPVLLEQGLKGMIGKGPRSPEVVQAIIAHKAVYFAAVGGAAALTAQSVVSCKTIAYDDLGPEAVRKLDVVSYPCIVAIDSLGQSIYDIGPAAYRR